MCYFAQRRTCYGLRKLLASSASFLGGSAGLRAALCEVGGLPTSPFLDCHHEGAFKPPRDLLFGRRVKRHPSPPALQRLFPAPDASPGTHPTPPLFPARIWCIFLPARLLQTLLFGPSITLGGDSGHGAADQSGLQYSVRQVTRLKLSRTESLGPRVCLVKQCT